MDRCTNHQLAESLRGFGSNNQGLINQAGDDSQACIESCSHSGDACQEQCERMADREEADAEAKARAEAEKESAKQAAAAMLAKFDSTKTRAPQTPEEKQAAAAQCYQCDAKCSGPQRGCEAKNARACSQAARCLCACHLAAGGCGTQKAFLEACVAENQ